MNCENSFFETEIRAGFVVPSFMKYAWAAQLNLLNIVDEICEKYSLHYYAAWGTLIGTVRHKGFIPWDDDLDIYMKRPDYEKFLKYAEKELPEHAKVCSVYNDEGHGNCIATVFNTRTNCYKKEFLQRYAGFPCAVGIDIVVLDYLPDSMLEREQLKEALDFLVALIAHYDELSSSEQKQQLGLVKRSLGCRIERTGSQSVKRQLELLIERICRSHSSQESGELANFMQWQREKRLKMRAECFANIERHAFENTTLPIPVGYDEILKNEYGDYMTPINAGSGHGYPYFLFPYVDACEKMGMQDYAPDSMPVPRGKEWHQQQFQARLNLYMAQAKQLEKELMQNFSQEGFETLKQLTASMENEIVLENTREKKVLFVVCQKKYWSAMEPLINVISSDNISNIDILVLPYYYKNFGGDAIEKVDESNRYPDDLHIVKPENLTNSDWYYDRIYTQIPWDSYDLTISVDEMFFTEKLREHTDYLVYVPYITPDVFDDSAERANFTMQFLCRQPAVIQADRILLPSEDIKNIYLRKLVEYTGEETRDIWNSKLEVNCDLESIRDSSVVSLASRT